jgi:hypothetical protein
MIDFNRSRWAAVLLAASAAYAGLLAGVSFLATPAKFLTPSLSLPIALEIGRHTFALLNKAEWAAVSIVLLCATAVRIKWSILAALAIVAILLADTLWLLPTLDDRVALVMRGIWPGPSVLHHIYIAFDVTKFVLLIAIATACMRHIQNTD